MIADSRQVKCLHIFLTVITTPRRQVDDSSLI